MNMVWTYDAERDTVRPSTIENTGASTNFYSSQMPDGTYFDDLDEWLQTVENDAAAPYRLLLDGELPKGQGRADFATFIASSYARSLSIIRAYAHGFARMLELQMDVHLSNRETFNAFADKYQADTGEALDRDSLYEFWRDKERFSIEISQKRGLAAIGISDTIAPLLYERNWYLAYPESGYFITSDSPVVLDAETVHPIYGNGGFKNPRSFVTFPLSPKVLLVITGHRLAGNFVLRASGVAAMNEGRAVYAERFLYAHIKDEAVRALAAKYKDTQYRLHISGESKRSLAEVKLTR